MKEKLVARIVQHPIFKALQNAPAPRWVIFTCDMLIVAFVSLMLVLSGSVEIYESTQLYSFLLCIGIYASAFLATGIHKSILRMGISNQVLKIFWCVTLASVGIALVSSVYNMFYTPQTPLLGVFPILFIGIMVLCMMVSMRIIVKHLFTLLTSGIEQRENVIVLGTAINSLAMAVTLHDEIKGRYNPVALLALDDTHKEKTIQNFPIEQYSPNHITEIFRKHHCDTLVFLQTQTQTMRSGLAEEFMNAHIKLKVFNQIDEFSINSESDSPDISTHVNPFTIEELLGRHVIKTDSRRVQKALRGSTVLITGAAGSIGSEIVRQVASFDAECIILLDQAETPMHEMQLEMERDYPNVKTVLYMADVQNRVRLARAFKTYRPHYVFHAAAYKHVPMMEHNPTEAILTNVMGTKNMADLSLQFGVRKFVMVSTDKAVNPTNIMGASKRIAEIYVQSLFHYAERNSNGGMTPQYITTRFGNVLGSNGSVIPLFRKQIEAGGPLTLTHRDIIRYFMTIPEACSLVLEAGCMGHGGEIFIFDMGEPVKIYDLARRMIMLAGFKPGIDIDIVETGLRPGEKLYEELLNDAETTLPTDNEKIMIAKVRKYDFKSIVPHIDKLIELAQEGHVHDMVLTMKGLVPEYISNNSVFEDIDKELQHYAALDVAMQN